MTTATANKAAWADKEKIIGRIKHGADLELHVKETKIEGQTYVNIRDYVPSIQEYGKGTLIKRDGDTFQKLMEILNQYADYHFGRTGKPTAGQQDLGV